jgi:hypothetical protein
LIKLLLLLLMIKSFWHTSTEKAWNIAEPFLIAYIIFLAVMFILVISFIVYALIQVIRINKEMKDMKRK